MRTNRTRQHRVEVAMNDQEYKNFIYHVEQCGLTKQSYLLFLIKNKVPQPRPSENLQEVLLQLRKIGTNINQLAMIANKTGNIDGLKINRALEELNHQILEIRKQIFLPKEIQ